MVVHDIEVHDVRACLEYSVDVVAKAGKVGGEDRWGYQRFHGRVSFLVDGRL
jgi:hypothetical protein